MSAKLDTWRRKRDLRIQKKAKAKAERIHEWVLLRIDNIFTRKPWVAHLSYLGFKVGGGPIFLLLSPQRSEP